MYPLGHVGHCLCCECCDDRDPRRRRRRRVRFLTDEDQTDLLEAADAFNRDTGRTCADFFKTMRLPGNPEGALAGRPTLLVKMQNLNDIEARFAMTTICARLKIPPGGRYEAYRFDVSGFGFPRPTLGRYRSAAAAEAVCALFRRKQFPGSLEGCNVRDLGP